MGKDYNSIVLIIVIVIMDKNIEQKRIEWLESFNKETSNDISSNTSYELAKSLDGTKENLRKFWETFSDFYYISCAPFDKSIDQWKSTPRIYEILKDYVHTANGFPLEILIGKYSDESMAKAREITEERRKEYEWMWFTIRDPKEYMYFVGFFGGSWGRTNQYLIKEIREMFPDKRRVIKPE